MLSIDLDSSQLDKGFKQLLINARNKRKMMVSIATEMQSLTEDNFSKESFGNEKWIKSQRAIEQNGQTLQSSGQLAASISTHVEEDFARIGTNKIYSAIQHTGGSVTPKNKPYLCFRMGMQYIKTKKVTIPARPYLPINSEGKLQSGAQNRFIEIALEALSKNI